MLEITNKQFKEMRLLVNTLAKHLDDISDPPALSQAGKERVESHLQNAQCLYCSKPYGTEKIVRGVHVSCYSKLDYKFRRKRKPMTEKEAIAKGWLLQAYDSDNDNALPDGNVPIVGEPTRQQKEKHFQDGQEADKKLREAVPTEKPGVTTKQPKGGKR